MEVSKLVIPGDPISQPRQRHRAALVQGKMLSMNYTPAKHPVNDYKAAIRLAARELRPIAGPVALTVSCFFSRPKSHYGSGKNAERLKGTAPHWHVVKPDTDNVVKAIKDALKGLAWRDDSQVCREEIEKHYDDAPRTVVIIRAIEEAGSVALNTEAV
jgi:Holliday junction resolvase RusA-like endonuclease